jgi:hypothetical protein
MLYRHTHPDNNSGIAGKLTDCPVGCEIIKKTISCILPYLLTIYNIIHVFIITHIFNSAFNIHARMAISAIFTRDIFAGESYDGPAP